MTTSGTSVPTIQVGGDFRIGDVSGQVAIGNNISQTQIIYKDCIFVLPDGSIVQGRSWSYIQGIKPPTDPDNIFGRLEELDRIDELFNSTSALAITGFRGTGKSTLASMYIETLKEKRGDFAGIFWRKMDESVDIADVVGSFFSVIGKPVKDPGNYKIEDLLNLFFYELNAAPYFLVLDNFEILLDPKTNKPNKAGFSDLIEKANGGTGRSRILFTSWECPASDRGIRPNCYTIGGLDDQAAIQLLRKHGLTEPDNELQKAVELSGGHPLALILLVQLVIGEEEPLSSILKDNSLWVGEEGEVAEHILDKVYNERLNEKEQEFLQFISLYRLPVPLQAIVMAANDPAWTDIAKKTALTLKRKSLVQKTGDNLGIESLIKNYAYSKLDDKVERHKFAYQYYLSLPLPEPRTKKEDVQPLIEAHHHACRAKDFNKASNIIMDNNLYEDLDRWGNSRTLIDLYSGMLPEDHFGDQILFDDIGDHSIFLGNLGSAYYNLGQVETAIEYYQKALKIAQEIGDRRGEGAHLGNLGNAYRDLGQVEMAIEHYQKALKIAHEIGDRQGEGKWLGNLGNAYSDLGEVETAIEYYQKALAISKEIGDRRGEGNHLGNLGVAYSDLGQVEIAIEYYQNALKIAQEIYDRRNVGIWLGSLGNTYNDHGKVETAIEYYQDALKIAQEIGDRRGEGSWLGNLGNAYIDRGKGETAIEYYQKALKIAQEIGDRQGEGHWLGSFGLAYNLLGHVETAIEYYQDALKIAKEIADRRNEGNWLGNLGNAYSRHGQVETAIEYYQDALKIAQQIDDRQGEGKWLGSLGNAYSKLGQVETAIEYLKKALKIAQEIGDRRGEGADLGNLGLAYSQLGQVEMATDYYQKALAIGKETNYPLLINFCEENLRSIQS